jgi:signal transduction histidine kinase
VPDLCETVELGRAAGNERRASPAELTRMAAGIGHDFNNLLMVAMGFAETLVRSLEDPSEQRRAAVQIVRTCERASQLVHELRTLGEFQPMKPVELDLVELLASMQGSVRVLAGPRIQLQLQLESGVRYVLAAPLLVERVVLNLVKNAVHAMPAGGQLTIRARNLDESEVDLAHSLPSSSNRDDWVEVGVADTGTGMDEATAARAFEPYFTTRPGIGTGLGLATVRTIVQGLGGSVRAESRSGAGTVVRILLPAAQRGNRAVP